MKKGKLVLCYTLEFFVIGLALLYSFGNFSLVKGDDGFDQFYPVFVYCGKYWREVIGNMLHGQFSLPQYDFSIGMGEGIIPTLNYYGFGDPFMLFSVLTPVRYATYAYTAVIFLKMYVSGFGFICYCIKRNLVSHAVLAGLPLYITSNFLFYFCFQYPPYQSVLITLPFICMGLDEVIWNIEKKVKISIVLIFWYHLPLPCSFFLWPE